MTPSVSVTVDSSCYPGLARTALLGSFRRRRMDHRFHYETEKQAQLWLALHEAYSPARTDTDCQETYLEAFRDISKLLKGLNSAVISLGCGGGQKDVALLKSLASSKTELSYVPADVSLTLALTAHLLATKEIPQLTSNPVVMSLSATEDMNTLFAPLVPANARRLFALFGILPNFEPSEVLSSISNALQPDDLLLLSSNLAPGSDYRRGAEKVLPLYDNELTRRWLAAALIDTGLNLKPSDLEFQIAEAHSLLRIEAGYRFREPQSLRLDGESFAFEPGEWFRLFFSYRHSSALLQKLMSDFEIEIVQEWITASQEEGIFLCRKRPT